MLRARVYLNIRAERKQVFQVAPCKYDVNIKDIRDLVITCKDMDTRNKKDMFYSYGIDYDMVEKHYENVTKLNALIKPINDNVQDKNLPYYPLWYCWRMVIACLSMLFDRR